MKPQIQAFLASEVPCNLSDAIQGRGNASVPRALEYLTAKMVEHYQRFADLEVDNRALTSQVAVLMKHWDFLHDESMPSGKAWALKAMREGRRSKNNLDSESESS